MGRESESSERQGAAGKRRRIVRPYPNNTLEEAVAVAMAIQESNSGLPFDRSSLAEALGTTTSSSGFTIRINSCARYGLTHGRYNDPRISLTPRGEAIVAPKEGDEHRRALVEAALQPEVFSRFYQMLDGKRVPEGPYARNLLQRDLEIHPDLTDECLRIITANGLYAGIMSKVGRMLHVNLTGAQEVLGQSTDGASEHWQQQSASIQSPRLSVLPPPEGGRSLAKGKIFIGHRGQSEPVEFVKSVLEEFDIPYGLVEVSDSGAQPVPDEVSEEVRTCTAAVLIFGATPDGASTTRGPTEEMGYLLGAASVLYRNKVVIFLERGLTASAQPEGVRSVLFDPGRAQESGLELLEALHKAGAITITA